MTPSVNRLSKEERRLIFVETAQKAPRCGAKVIIND